MAMPSKGEKRSPLAEAPLALEFLDAQDVARLVCTEKRAIAAAADALWFWIYARMRRWFPYADMPRDPPSRAALHPRVLLVLLRRLHAASAYSFDVRFDAMRRGGDVHLPHDGAGYVSHWGADGGSMLGDRACPPAAVSYWECEGLSEGGYLGVAAVAREDQPGFHYYGLDTRHLARTLSLPPPACDHMPGVMYCESGFITTGAFRGPKPRLPSRVPILHASPFLETDRVGVLVDLVEGFIAFTCNGRVQGMAIPIDRDRSHNRAFIPVFSAATCYDLRLVRGASPPWRSVYPFHDLRRWLRDPGMRDSEGGRCDLWLGPTAAVARGA